MRRAIAPVQRRLWPQSVILMYHRIGDVTCDPWCMNVTPANFAEQLAVLQRHFHVISLAQLAHDLASGRRRKRCVALTFDDGYADNLYAAKPLLQHYSTPATVFVTSSHIGYTREFWWDELEQIILIPVRLPPRLVFDVGQEHFEWDLGAAQAIDRWANTGQLFRPWDAPSASRLELYYRIWLLLRPLPWQQRYHQLDNLAEWAGTRLSCRPSHRTLDVPEALRLLNDSAITIGAHTQTHPSLMSQELHMQRQEIEQSKRDLESRFGKVIAGFSYPHGDYSPQTLEIVRSAGFSYACTVKAAGVTSQADLFQLPRYEVRNWAGQEFLSRLKHWLSS